MRRAFAVAVVIIVAEAMLSPVAAATTKTKPPAQGPSMIAQLDSAMKITSGQLQLGPGNGVCFDGNEDDDLVQVNLTIRNLSATKAIRAVRALLTWTFIDAYQATDMFTTEWGQVATVPPRGRKTFSGVPFTVNCDDRGEAFVQGQADTNNLTFSYVPLEVVFTDHQRIGPPPTN
jgi:hypothetical protein